MTKKTCTTHYFACDCREDYLKELEEKLKVTRKDYATCSAERDTLKAENENLKGRLRAAKHFINRFLQRVDYDWDSQAVVVKEIIGDV